MKKYLLAISIGPVQDFIAAARKTADLYAGSQLLVKVAEETAKSIMRDGGTLIFPALKDDGEVSDGPNKILAELAEGIDPASVAKKAEKAARHFVRNRWDQKCGALPQIDTARALAQVDGFLEFYAAWYPLSADYETCRQELDHLLAGRKALREFRQPQSTSGAGLPKSPLDPSRECVIRLDGAGKHGLTMPEGLMRPPFSLKQNEFLDAISLLKRLSRSPNVPSTSMMAYRSFAKTVSAAIPEALKEVEARLKSVTDPEWQPDLGDLFLREPLLPRDAQAVLTLGDRDALAQLDEDARRLKGLLKAKGKDLPLPYYALLQADGDKMGAIIGALHHPERHQEFSRALSEFAQSAKRIVHRHDGYLVYSGGDDVLALLPVNRAIECAAELQRDFAQKMKKYRDLAKLSEDTPGGTLSAGIAIAHHLEDLQISLTRVRDAEKAAKKKRNSLAVALHTRGGAPLTVSEEWRLLNDPNSGIDWKRWTDAFRGGLARGFPYELKSLIRDWSECYEGEDKIDRLKQEFVRLLRRKRGSEGGEKVLSRLPGYDQKGNQAGLIPVLNRYDSWVQFADKLVICRFLARFPETETESHD